MIFDVITHKSKWEMFLNSFTKNQKDIYFDYKYLSPYEKNGDGEANCAIFIGENGMKLLYPFIKTKIPGYGLTKAYYDISSCYGYGGPLIDLYNVEDMVVFERHFCHWCKDNNIIAEFIRFHPLINDFDKFKVDMKIEKNRNTVYVDLSDPLEDIWKNSITSKNRNQIRRAEKSGVVIRESLEIKNFTSIYEQTMKRLQAGDYFYFSDDYNKELLKLVPENMMILEAVFEEQVIAAAMFIFMGNKMHYHLAGSLREYSKLCPNNLILWNAIKYGLNNGYKYLHLGGGTTSSDKDSLLKFKKSFSPNIKEFYIGKRVHNQEVYNLLIKKWEEKYNRQAKLFLQYEFI